MSTRLPYREEIFATEVAAFMPPDRAYGLAGFKSKPHSARGNAARLLRKPEVRTRIDELRAEYRERCGLHVEYIQSLLLPIVEANALDYFAPATADQEATGRRHGRKDKLSAMEAAGQMRLRLKSPAELCREQGLAISALKLDDAGRVVDVKFHAKTEAARLLLATLGIGGESEELSLVDLGARLGAALERAKGNGRVIEGQVIERPATLSEDAPAAAEAKPRIVVEC